jgi:hypothetical protein
LTPTPPRGLLLALASSNAVIALIAPTAVPAAPDQPSEATELVGQIAKHRSLAWHWQRVMGTRRTPTRFAEQKMTSLDALGALRDRWQAVAAGERKRAKRPPHRGAWSCIQRHEGRWNDPGAPYYGGLQMDLTFQRRYGKYLLRRKGTANRWTRLEQMWTAEKALRAGRGFYPWPVAASRCGLI